MANKTAQDPFVGRVIDGYHVDKLLGKGGMARVYRGHDEHLSRYVAMKVIEPDVQADPEYRTRFQKEARAVAQLDHPNIVRIYRFGEVEGQYYMVMQYIEGTDLGWVLDDYAADNELMPYENVLPIISQIGPALDYAHRRGVIHRDIKPSNIMLDMDSSAILTDFGLALLQVEGSRGEIFGSPHYIAPEQAMNSAGAIPQSDIYSLSVILYEMLTGSVPFSEGSAVDIAMAHVSEPLPHPHDRNPNLHPAFVEVLDKALQKEPRDRFQSGAELAAALMYAVDVALRSQEPTRPAQARLSQLQVPDKVSEFRRANPLPPLPAPVQPASPQDQVTPGVRKRSSTPAHDPRAPQRRTSSQRNVWLAVVVACIVVVLLGLVAVAALLSGNLQNSDANQTGIPSGLPSDAPTTIPVLILPSVTAVSPPTTALPPTSETIRVALRFVTNGEESLYIENISPWALPLTPLVLRGQRRGEVQGAEWGVAELRNNECVRLVKDRDAESPGITCTSVGEALRRGGNDRFWKPEFDTFAVYYAGEFVGDCSTSLGCFLTITVRP